MPTHFELELEELHVQMITMGNLCERAITLSVDALRDRREDMCGQVFRTDRAIDEKEREIETLCLRLLLHQHPVAGDLRRISAVLKMISDMERIGDQAADIADLSRYIDKTDNLLPEEIAEMARNTRSMVTESIDAFVHMDLERCRKVIDADDLVDEGFNQAKEKLGNLILERVLDAKIGLDFLMTAKYFERIGDHAVNIAEWVEYSMTGEHRNHEHHAYEKRI